MPRAAIAHAVQEGKVHTRVPIVDGQPAAGALEAWHGMASRALPFTGRASGELTTGRAPCSIPTHRDTRPVTVTVTVTITRVLLLWVLLLVLLLLPEYIINARSFPPAFTSAFRLLSTPFHAFPYTHTHTHINTKLTAFLFLFSTTSSITTTTSFNPNILASASHIPTPIHITTITMFAFKLLAVAAVACVVTAHESQ